jgi:hypothetical protein
MGKLMLDLGKLVFGGMFMMKIFVPFVGCMVPRNLEISSTVISMLCIPVIFPSERFMVWFCGILNSLI